ncbi:MAG: hypothetical protein WC807_16540 [Hyphomicrobium sp.]|jgi:hypothetical protein
MFFIVGSLTAMVCGLVVLNIALTLVPDGNGLGVWAVGAMKSSDKPAREAGDERQTDFER